MKRNKFLKSFTLAPFLWLKKPDKQINYRVGYSYSFKEKKWKSSGQSFQYKYTNNPNPKEDFQEIKKHILRNKDYKEIEKFSLSVSYTITLNQ